MAQMVRVVSVLAVVKDTEGKYHHVYQGGLLSGAQFDPEHVDGLIAVGMLEVVEVADEVTEDGNDPEPESELEPEPEPKPARSSRAKA